MQEVDLTWNRVLRVWWLIYWRAASVGFLLSFVIGVAWGIIGTSIGVPDPMKYTISMLLGMVTASAWGIVVIRMALTKNFQEFRLALVANGRQH